MFSSKLTLRIRRQIIAAVICNIGGMMIGCNTGWAAPTLKKLRQPDSTIHLTTIQEGWLASANFWGAAITSIPTGQLINYLGRRNTLFLLGAVQIISWTLIYFSNSAPMLIVARLLAGFYGGGVQIILPTYLSETSEPHVRGIFSSLTTVCFFIGNILIFVVAPYVSIPTMAIICIILVILFLLLLSLCPESPYFYVMRQKPEAAAKSLTWLRGGESIAVELDMIRTSVNKEMENNSGWARNTVALVTVPANRKIFLSVEIMFILYSFSGFNCVRTFSSVVLPPRLGPLTSDHCTIIMGAADFAAALTCMGLIDKVGRKPLLYCSSLGMAISMFWIGVWYFLKEETDIDVSNLIWLPFAGFTVFGCSYSFGMGPIPRIYQSEVLPSNLKGQVSAFTTILLSCFIALSVALFPIMTENFGIFSNFFLSCTVAIIFIIYTFFCVIETKGKSLQMIRTEFEGEKVEEPKIDVEVTKM